MATAGFSGGRSEHSLEWMDVMKSINGEEGLFDNFFEDEDASIENSGPEGNDVLDSVILGGNRAGASTPSAQEDSTTPAPLFVAVPATSPSVRADGDRRHQAEFPDQAMIDRLLPNHETLEMLQTAMSSLFNGQTWKNSYELISSFWHEAIPKYTPMSRPFQNYTCGVVAVDLLQVLSALFVQKPNEHQMQPPNHTSMERLRQVMSRIRTDHDWSDSNELIEDSVHLLSCLADNLEIPRHDFRGPLISRWKEESEESDATQDEVPAAPKVKYLTEKKFYKELETNAPLIHVLLKLAEREMQPERVAAELDETSTNLLFDTLQQLPLQPDEKQLIDQSNALELVQIVQKYQYDANLKVYIKKLIEEERRGKSMFEEKYGKLLEDGWTSKMFLGILVKKETEKNHDGLNGLRKMQTV